MHPATPGTRIPSRTRRSRFRRVLRAGVAILVPLALALGLLGLLAGFANSATVVCSTDVESGLPPGFTAPGATVL